MTSIREERYRDRNRTPDAGVPEVPTRRESRIPSGKPAKGYLSDRRFRKAPKPDTG